MITVPKEWVEQLQLKKGDLVSTELDEGSLVAALDYANRAAAINCGRAGMDPPRASELAD